MFEVSNLPHLNAILNLISSILLFSGWWAIKKKRKELHIKFMCCAFLSSTAFLISYLSSHYFGNTNKYVDNGPSWFEYPYYTLLTSHVILAVVIVPMVLRTFFLALKKRLPEHKSFGKITLALWAYVSVTGVVIYLILYQQILGS